MSLTQLPIAISSLDITPTLHCWFRNRLSIIWVVGVARLYLQHGLLILTVLHLSLREIKDGPLHLISITIVDVDIGTSDHHIPLHPASSVRLQKMQVPLLRNNGAERKKEMILVVFQKFSILD